MMSTTLIRVRSVWPPGMKLIVRIVDQGLSDLQVSGLMSEIAFGCAETTKQHWVVDGTTRIQQVPTARCSDSIPLVVLFSSISRRPVWLAQQHLSSSVLVVDLN